jgi:broad specificity phosphatase PhoE
MRILLIRHGQTDYNLANRVQGSTDIPLNSKGMEQACGVNLECNVPECGIHSGLLRASKTLDIIFHNNYKHDCISIHSNQLLRERQYGIFEGLTHDEIKEKYPTLYAEWRQNENASIPGAESIEDVQERAKSFLDYVFNSFQNNVIAVTHSGFMHALYKYLFEIHSSDPSELHINNCDVFEITYVIVDRKVRFEFKFDDRTIHGEVAL